MPTFLLRIFFLHNLLSSLLLSLVPKKIRQFLPSSWFPPPQKTLADEKSTPSPPAPPSSSPSLSSLVVKTIDPAELKRVFQTFDRNGDGRITKKELSVSLENLGIYIPDDDLRQMIEKIDANGDGCVDIGEFGGLYQSIMEEEREGKGEAEVREAFEVFDENGDGFISVDELRSVMRSLGLKQGRSVEDCKKMIMKVDDDGDGRVDYAEFKKMMKFLA